eukprot:CAMPEP_0196682830 /NCGR_PEP_ID=MMETSP1090-20130531/9490_1 /TAXON_ID=37098 /ORGANISM="Isochrysis sp, Strain CCMP1244" /LENGTH=149 /DNA_ID=CAMNT_0042021257 /DNA_START=30 /DNA_END=476 /DNA_ORIENTATION=-
MRNATNQRTLKSRAYRSSPRLALPGSSSLFPRRARRRGAASQAARFVGASAARRRRTKEAPPARWLALALASAPLATCGRRDSQPLLWPEQTPLAAPLLAVAEDARSGVLQTVGRRGSAASLPLAPGVAPQAARARWPMRWQGGGGVGA